MNITPDEFIKMLQSGKSESELNKTESLYVDMAELRKLTSKRYGHSHESATKYLQTDYSNGYTICSKCGSYYHLGKGFTKHLSNGCLHCEGESKHRVYHVNASEPKYGGFPARWMSQMFDDGMQYCKDKLSVNKYQDLVSILIKINLDGI